MIFMHEVVDDPHATAFAGAFYLPPYFSKPSAIFNDWTFLGLCTSSHCNPLYSSSDIKAVICFVKTSVSEISIKFPFIVFDYAQWYPNGVALSSDKDTVSPILEGREPGS